MYSRFDFSAINMSLFYVRIISSMIAYILQQITIIESQFKFEHYYVLQHKKYEFEYP